MILRPLAVLFCLVMMMLYGWEGNISMTIACGFLFLFWGMVYYFAPLKKEKK